MPVSVHCPRCEQELVAPDELVGRLAACPGCNFQFPITLDRSSRQNTPPLPLPPAPLRNPRQEATPRQEASPRQETAPSRTVEPPLKKAPPTDSYFPPGRTPAPPATATTSAPPTTVVPSTTAVPPTSAAPPTMAAPPASRAPTPARPATKSKATPREPAPAASMTPAAPAAPTPPASSTTSPVSTSGTRRDARPARFIAGQSTETVIQLGQDGQLPSLVLTEGKSSSAEDEPSQKSNPLLLVAVLCFSLLASLGMLLLDTESRRVEPESKELARQEIEQHYIRGTPLLQPYQQELRLALQAYNRRNQAEEKAQYKKVFAMLQQENKNPFTGLTGRVAAPLPPNDEHLESLLKTLLR